MGGGKEKSKMEWSRDAVLTLIENWERFDILCDSKHKLFKNKHARWNALFEIAEKVRPFLPCITPEAVWVKIGYLRGQYSREKGKLRETMRSGVDTDDKRDTPYWFEKMQFVDEHLKARKSTSNCENILDISNISKSSNEDIIIGNTNSSDSLLSPPPAKAPRTEIESDQTALERASAAIEAVASTCLKKSTVKNDVEAFGLHIMAELEKITDEKLFDETQNKVQNILYESKYKQRELNKTKLFDVQN